MSTLFENFLLELAKVLHFKTLAPDSYGACLIIIKEGNVPLLFEFDDQLVPNTILVSTPIAPIPIPYREALYEASLMGNHNLEGTLSVKPDEDILYFHRRLHPSIQAEDLEKLLRIFLENISFWKERVATILQNTAPSDKMPHPSSIQVFPYKA